LLNPTKYHHATILKPRSIYLNATTRHINALPSYSPTILIDSPFQPQWLTHQNFLNEDLITSSKTCCEPFEGCKQ
jgi:hypothetical protein